MGGVTMWQVNPLLLREIETLLNKTGTNSWSNFVGFWLVAVDTRLAGSCVHPDVEDYLCCRYCFTCRG